MKKVLCTLEAAGKNVPLAKRLLSKNDPIVNHLLSMGFRVSGYTPKTKADRVVLKLDDTCKTLSGFLDDLNHLVEKDFGAPARFPKFSMEREMLKSRTIINGKEYSLGVLVGGILLFIFD